MKWSVYAFVCWVPLLAQQVTRTSQFDGFGNALPSPTYSTSVSGGTSTRVESRPSVNGNLVPAQTVQERVLSDDGRKRVVEREIKLYDANGNALPAERVRIEEDKQPSGAVTTRMSVFRADINGNLSLAERSVKETRSAGSSTQTTETVERPSINGSVEAAEKRATTVQIGNDQETRSTVVYKKDQNGQFYEAVKKVGESRKTSAGIVDNESTFENYGGKYRLVDQTVRRTVKNANGNEQVEENLYRETVPGLAPQGETQAPQLVQQRLITRQASAGGLSETVDVRRTSPSQPDRLGSPVRESQSVCTGKCK